MVVSLAPGLSIELSMDGVEDHPAGVFNPLNKIGALA